MTTYPPLTCALLNAVTAVESAISHARSLASHSGELAFQIDQHEIEKQFKNLRISLESPEIRKAILVLRDSCRKI